MSTSSSAMNVDVWLRHATKKLEQAGVGTAHLDCLVLLEDATGKDRAHLLAHPEMTFQGQSLEKLNGWMERRMQHEPLAYIRGKIEFYGGEFLVDKRVLVPRPESETMIELALKVIGDRLQVTEKPVRAIDIGTGSGALAITLKLEIPAINMLATDIDRECLKVARQNAKKHRVKIKFFQGDLLEPLKTENYKLKTILLANLPYVPDSYRVNHEVLSEPHQAIFGGQDGLDLYRRLFQQIATLLQKPTYILTESLPFQHAELVKIAHAAGYKLHKTDDFIQAFKKVDSTQ